MHSSETTGLTTNWVRLEAVEIIPDPEFDPYGYIIRAPIFLRGIVLLEIL